MSDKGALPIDAGGGGWIKGYGGWDLWSGETQLSFQSAASWHQPCVAERDRLLAALMHVVACCEQVLLECGGDAGLAELSRAAAAERPGDATG